MPNRALLWLVSLPLLVLLVAGFTLGRSKNTTNANLPMVFPDPWRLTLQEPDPSPTPVLVSTPTATRARRPTPTSTPAANIPPQHNPGLIVGGVLVLAVILIGVFSFTRRK
jgi:hypothetical protein